MSGSGERRSGDRGSGPDRDLVLLVLAALLGGIVACVAGLASGKRLQVIAGTSLIVLSIGTLLGAISRSYAWRPFASALRWRERVYRWQNVIQLALVAVVFTTPPMAEEEPLLDLACDVFGATGVVAGGLLRLWAAGHPEERRPFARRLSARVVTDGAYAYMRQPPPGFPARSRRCLRRPAPCCS